MSFISEKHSSVTPVSTRASVRRFVGDLGELVKARVLTGATGECFSLMKLMRGLPPFGLRNPNRQVLRMRRTCTTSRRKARRS
jgi:hypothetical protein